MSFTHRQRVTPIAKHVPELTTPAPQSEPAAQPTRQTRASMTWMRVGAAILIVVVLIIFAVQNTRGVEISFLWMTTSTSLVLALLIGAIGGSLLTLVLSTARITRLRREIRGTTR